MIGLHEGDVSYEKVPYRGAQFYPNCVQIEVTGDGAVELPAGVSFPGAYKYSDPGVVYDVSSPAGNLSHPFDAYSNRRASGLLLHQDEPVPDHRLHHHLSDPRYVIATQ